MATRKRVTPLESTEPTAAADKAIAKEKPVSCGLVMPISSIDGCSPDHWSEVKNIITESIEGIAEPKFTVRLVSDADDVGVIQKRIVQNIYNSDIVVCDVSGKNPNVMFELGMRLAFDKPTIIVKDDKTDYTFDTGVIEHIGYPRDLRFARIVTFKASLAEKVAATHRAAAKDPNHSTFLKSFGKFQVAALTEDAVPADRLVVEMLTDLQLEVSRLRRVQREPSREKSEGATVAIIAAIQKFRQDNPGIALADLAASESFFSKMERMADAPRYFRGPSDFREACEDVIRHLSRLEDRAV